LDLFSSVLNSLFIVAGVLAFVYILKYFFDQLSSPGSTKNGTQTTTPSSALAPPKASTASSTMPPEQKPKPSKYGRCPKCGSMNFQVISEKSSGFNTDSCCGAILFGPLGILCGASSETTSKRICLNCGNKF